MKCFVLSFLLILQGAFTQYGSYYPASWVPRRPGCGPCPQVADCRQLPEITYGFCCGCALSIDRVPIICPPALACPCYPQLCSEYNYLMDCCC